MHGQIQGYARYRQVLAKNGRRYDFKGQLLSTPPPTLYDPINYGSRTTSPSREMTDKWASGL